MIAFLAAAVLAAGVLAALGTRWLARVPEGDTFTGALPSVWLPVVLAGASAAVMAPTLHRQDWGAQAYAVLPAYVWLAAAGALLGLIDVALHRLPDVLTKGSYPVVAVLLVVGALVVGEPRRLLGAGAGMVGMLLLYGLLWVVNPNGMGFGDVKLSGVLGMALGFLGADALLWGAVLGFVVSALAGLVVLARHRSDGLKAHVPHGPGMLVGFLLGVVVA